MPRWLIIVIVGAICFLAGAWRGDSLTKALLFPRLASTVQELTEAKKRGDLLKDQADRYQESLRELRERERENQTVLRKRDRPDTRLPPVDLREADRFRRQPVERPSRRRGQ